MRASGATPFVSPTRLLFGCLTFDVLVEHAGIDLPSAPHGLRFSRSFLFLRGRVGGDLTGNLKPVFGQPSFQGAIRVPIEGLHYFWPG